MTWLPLLLADPSPCLRILVLTELMARTGDDPEVRELIEVREQDPLIADLLASQSPDGSWTKTDPAGLGHGSVIQTTSQAMMRLGYLGSGIGHPAVQRSADYLFSRQRQDGSWPLPTAHEDGESGEGYEVVSLQTSLPLRALALAGLATDPRAEKAYEWLLAQRLPDGAWPTGIACGVHGRVAGYRRMAHSRWGCRSNTTGAVAALSLHPERRNSPEARRALDLLLARETRERTLLGHETARTVGIEPARGFFTYFARFDPAQMLDLCWRTGASQEDARIAGLVAFVRESQGTFGLWEYVPRPQATRWVTFDLLRSLKRLDGQGDWLSLEPRTPFQSSARVEKRF